MKNQTIGSIKLGRLNYKRDDNFFNSNYPNKEKQKIKREIEESVNPDYLGIKKLKWNNSVSLKNDIFDFNNHVQFFSSFNYLQSSSIIGIIIIRLRFTNIPKIILKYTYDLRTRSIKLSWV